MSVLIVLPAFNEAATIAHVASVVSNGLLMAGHAEHSEILLVDSDSTDDTVNQFRKATGTISKKIMVTDASLRGKGRNLLEAFAYFVDSPHIFCLVIDSDLKSIEPSWVSQYLKALTLGADFVIPCYKRSMYEGSATNHFVVPALYALTGRFIRQPIAGDFGLSKPFVQSLLSRNYHPDTKRYGIDVFMTYSAIETGRRISSVALSQKVHKPSFPMLATMFPQIANSLLSQAQHYPYAPRHVREELPVGNQSLVPAEFPHRAAAMAMRAQASATFLALADVISLPDVYDLAISDIRQKGGITAATWAQVLAHAITAPSPSDTSALACLLELYKIRVVSFWLEVDGGSPHDAEIIVLHQTRLTARAYDCFAGVHENTH